MISKCLGQSLFPFLLRTQLEAQVKHPEGVKNLILVFWGSLRINNLQAQKSRFFNFFTASPS